MTTDSMHELYMLRGPAPGEVYPLAEKSVTVGRDALSTIMVNDPEVSRQHALIFRASSGIFQIQDLGSTNGTYVNGNRLGSEPSVLKPLDVITMGGAVTLVLREIEIDRWETPEPGEISENPQESDSARVVAGAQDIQEPAVQNEPDELPRQDLEDVPQLEPQSAIETETLLPSDHPKRDEIITGSSDEILFASEPEADAAKEPSPNVILGLVLLLLCCCLSLLIFLIYLGGDWYLRQLGLVP